MNPEAQRIALAESQGWKIEPTCYAPWNWMDPGGFIARIEQIPDYLGNLDAIHAAAKAECEKRGWNYEVKFFSGHYLARFTEGFGPIPKTFASTMNPSQCAALAEAYLRAINQWTE